MSTTSLPTVPRPLPPRLRRPKSIRPVWEEKPTIAGTIAKFILLGLMIVAILLPLWMVVITSFSTQETINQAGGLVLIPGEFTVNAYKQLFAGGVVTRAVGVSVFITGVGTLPSLVVTILAAYGLSRPGTLFHTPLLFVFLLTMFFGAGIIPSYLLISQLGLIDNLWALILPTSVSAFNIIIMRAFFMNIDQGILDSARIDGAGEFRVLATMVVPMSKAVIAVVGLFYGVGYWNAFFNAMLYLNDTAKWPLQLVLRSYVLQGTTQTTNDLAAVVEGGAVAAISVQMAVVVLALIPILLVYPFVQRHFRSGVMIGAVKG